MATCIKHAKLAHRTVAKVFSNRRPHKILAMVDGVLLIVVDLVIIVLSQLGLQRVINTASSYSGLDSVPAYRVCTAAP